jgi:precorrin-2 dehydrogenase/sirohydrochlorin ferrochelatase
LICPEKILICNIADTPPLCDYYLGELSQRPCENCDFDQRKITYNCQAIARVFEVIPEDINAMVENLNEYRKTLKGNFEEKVQK